MFSINKVLSYFFIPISFVYFEVVLKIITKQPFVFLNILACVLTCMAAGFFVNIICSLFKSEIINKWISVLILEIIAIIYLISLFVYNTFKNFNDIETILGGANGVATEFASTVWATISKGLGTIIIYEIPSILFIILFIIFKILHMSQIKKQSFLGLIIGFILFEGSGLGIMFRNENYKMKLTRTYCFDLVAQTFNLPSAYKIDAIYLIFGNPFNKDYYETEAYIDTTISDRTKYGISEIDIDLYKPTDNKQITKINNYVSSQTPSSKNKYTGLFKGKNIIFITAESLSTEAIQEDITPTLYKLKTEGINFTNYYQPYYNSSTATGEFANLLGIIPTSGMKSFKSTIGKNLYFTIGNETLRKNYTNIAYHNGTVEYYQRYITHPNFGYEKFIACGNGMEDTITDKWPRSDLEMFEYSVKQYIDKTPFCIYYMTLTPHFPYIKDNSVMIDKYGSMVENKGYSPFLEAYMAANIDFDKGLEYLLKELEKNDLLEDTVIVISPDHYSYGLTESDSFGTDKNYLPELFGYEPENVFQRDHNSLIIWSGSLTNKAQITVNEPVYSVDILPTLLNLFDLEYDSRLLAGRDVFSDSLPLVIWPDYSWLTDKGYYISSTNTFVQTSDDVSAEYVNSIQKIVANKMIFSRSVLETDYYNYLFK